MVAKKNKFGSYTFHCDFCPDYFDTIEDSIKDAWEDAKEAGWRSVFNSKGNTANSTHYCPDCWEKRDELNVY